MVNENRAQEADVRAQEAESTSVDETAPGEKEERVRARDGVSMPVKCCKTMFSEDENGNRIISSNDVHEGIILASYETGAVSISDRVDNVMLSVRIDELMALLTAAAEAAAKIERKVKADAEPAEQEASE